MVLVGVVEGLVVVVVAVVLRVLLLVLQELEAVVRRGMTVLVALDVVGVLCLVEVELLAATAEFLVAFGRFGIGLVGVVVGIVVGAET